MSTPHSIQKIELTAFAVVIETVLLALHEVLTKYLTTRYPVELIMVIRFAVSSIYHGFSLAKDR